MTDSQLLKSSLYNLLYETGEQRAEGRVRSVSLLEEMSLIGFIPSTDYFWYQFNFTSINLNSPVYVAPGLVKFAQDAPIYQYYKNITKATGKRYRIDGRIYIDSFSKDFPTYNFKSIISNGSIKQLPINGKQLLLSFKKFIKSDLLIKNDDETYDYIGREGELELYDGIKKSVAISNDFLCLCSYMNKVTGNPSYAVLTSYDTIRVLSENGV